MIKREQIIYDDNPFIRTKSEDVSFPISKEDEQLGLDMFEYVKASQDEEYAEANEIRAGVGLAAIQVGVAKKIIAIYINEEEDNIHHEYILVNPKIISHSIREAYLANGEACLSVGEDAKGYIHRYYKVTIRAYDLLTKQNIEQAFFGYPAIVIQHEIDHLSGILYYDHIDKDNPWLIKQNSTEI